MSTLALLWLGGALALCARDLLEEWLWPTASEGELGFVMLLNAFWPIALIFGAIEKLQDRGR